jgi:hypothetical protein
MLPARIIMFDIVSCHIDGHYFLTSIGSKASAPLRPYLTTLQLVQFLIILGQVSRRRQRNDSRTLTLTAGDKEQGFSREM